MQHLEELLKLLHGAAVRPNDLAYHGSQRRRGMDDRTDALGGFSLTEPKTPPEKEPVNNAAIIRFKDDSRIQVTEDHQVHHNAYNDCGEQQQCSASADGDSPVLRSGFSDSERSYLRINSKSSASSILDEASRMER